MHRKKLTATSVLCCLIWLLVTPLHGVQQKSPAVAEKEWIRRSNENARVLLEVQAKFSPEQAASLGIDGYDTEISDIGEGAQEKERAAVAAAVEKLTARKAQEKDPLVAQDLEIMIDDAQQDIAGSLLMEKYNVPYLNVPGAIFASMNSLLDDQIPEIRRQAALVRLRKYTGLAAGYRPWTQIARERTMAKINQPNLLMPFKAEVERHLRNTPFVLDGVEQLFQEYKIENYQEPVAKLREQAKEYDLWVRETVLPKSRTDFRLPAELYAYNLKQFGVDLTGAELAEIAHASFNEIQAEMQKLGTKIAQKRSWKDADYRAVIKQLKQEQLVGEAILPHYQQRLKQIEDILRREKLVTVPERPARIQLSSPAESAQQPAPNMRPPRMIGNTGEQGTFMLPLNNPAAQSNKPGESDKNDDFTYEAASWTLTAHEARPGHEMQFAAMIENGVSNARAVFAFNSTNVEGWGLYAEEIVLPYMPDEGKLISLDFRLMRAARAFLDPELQMGKVTPEQAYRVLREDVVLSHAMATQEVDRYTFRAPGQATSYFNGYRQIVQLRRDAEKALGRNFNALKFHDVILAQGLLPPRLLRKAVLTELGVKPGN